MSLSQLLSQRHSKSALPLVMGILNVTPDSFSDGGQLFDNQAANRDAVLKRAAAMIEQGADILDVGGESTRPGAEKVSQQQELDRVIPVLEWLKASFDIPVSVDTSTPAVMAAATTAGADMLNDVRAFQRDGALAVAARSNLPVCLMHMQGEPQTMQAEPAYQDVVDEVAGFLKRRAQQCIDAGVAPEQLVIDPGFGFGKSLEHNLALFRAIPQLSALGYPLLIGVSRKSMIGAILNKTVEQRLQGSVAMALLAAQQGADILRVHDVGETVDALQVWQAVKG